MLTTNKNINEIIKQTQQLKVENILVSNKKKFLKLKDKLKKSNIKIFNNFKDFNKIIKKKLDYTMCAISGLDGLNPTINIIKSTKNIAIANKESIICGWNLIDKELKKYKTKFIPVDSEHFSIWSSINKINQNLIDQVILTASGGPFLKKNNKFLKKATIKSALKTSKLENGKKNFYRLGYFNE